ncbi:MAG: hypothetical protein IT377_05340 [Polyangiaceae bacterium]|nr:hypothetical protein [Polyangiaceae bacterium]
MLRRLLIALGVSLVAVTARAESKPAKPRRPAPALVAKPTRPALAVAPRVSRAVEVLWGGQWWAAEVLETRSGITRIHYTGWGSEWDEWVGPERIRAAAPAAPVAPLASARVGQRVDVEWHGSWWPAEVVTIKNGFYKIHYTGWGPEWDEWVELPRMRARTAPRARTTPPEIAGQTS